MASVERIADETGSINRGASSKRGTSLDIRRKRKFILVVIGFRGGITRPGGPWFWFGVWAMWLIDAPLESVPLSEGSGVDV